MPPRRQAVLVRLRTVSAAACWVLAAGGLGCASPGPPRSPSLQIPAAPTGLSAARVADTVTLTVPALDRATDRSPLRSGTYRGVLCRSVGPRPCVTLSAIQTTVQATVPTTPAARQNHRPTAKQPALSFADRLPPDLAAGAPRLLAYRVEFFSPSGLSAGKSDPVFAVAGASPSPVTGLRAAGSRAGALLTWMPLPTTTPGPDAGTVVISREDLSPAASVTPRQAATLWFNANSAGAAGDPGITLDATLKPGVAYRYRAFRIRRITLAGHALELRSEPSNDASLILAQTFPPATPTGLTAAPTATATAFAIDLIWQPVDDPGPATHIAPPLAGYNIYREALGTSPAAPTHLNAAPLLTPAFHDATALSTQRYRYAVTAIDTAGNESPAATITVDP